MPPGHFHLPRSSGDDELEFEATLTPGLEAADMFASIYHVTREYTGIAQFIRVAMTFRKYGRLIRFPLPVRMAMTVFGALGRALGLRGIAPAGPG